MQRFVGILVENGGSRAATVTMRLFSLDACPMTLAAEASVPVDPGCAVGLAFDLPGFFYEARIGLPGRNGLTAAVYGLAADYSLVAANTMHPSQLQAV